MGTQEFIGFVVHDPKLRGEVERRKRRHMRFAEVLAALYWQIKKTGPAGLEERYPPIAGVADLKGERLRVTRTAPSPADPHCIDTPIFEVFFVKRDGDVVELRGIREVGVE